MGRFRIATYSHNIALDVNTGLSPFNLFFGRTDNGNVFNHKITEAIQFNSAYDEIKYKIKTLNEIAKQKKAEIHLKNKLSYDEKAKCLSFVPGERALCKLMVRDSFDPVYEKVEILRDINDQNAEIKRRNENIVVNKNMLYKLSPKLSAIPIKSKL